MVRVARVLLALAAAGGLTGPAWAQGTWVGHRQPCKLSTGYFLINGGVMHLKQAVESRFPDQRASRLAEAQQVLLQAITTGGQEENPAAWYYLGRYYAEVLDAAGADSAFRRAVALAPDCASDVASHTAPLAAIALNDALRLWGASQRDSAIAAFALARGLAPDNSEVPLREAQMYASLGDPDAAARALEQGAARVTAAGDTTRAPLLRQTELDVARAYEAQADQRAPVIRTVARTRAARDSIPDPIARDSALLARILKQVGDVRTSGHRLNPQSLASFQRDSTILTERIARERREADSLTTAAVAESTAAVAALQPALRYYERYLARYPEETDAALALLRLYAATGDRAALDSLVRRLVASPTTDEAALVQGGLNLYGDGLAAPATTLLEAALARNPNDERALSVVVRTYYALGRAAPLAAVARRLIGLQPLSAACARAMAMAWDLAGQADSTARYLALADTGLAWNVTITQFNPGEHSTSLNGYVRNVSARTLPTMTLVFEFLDASGAVTFSEPVAVAALEPGARNLIEIRSEQTGAVAWRYRRE
jgi:hypothetical protein